MTATTATRISPAYDDVDAVLSVVRSTGPYWPLANYAGNDAEMAALGSRPVVILPPWFRQDIAAGGRPLVAGGEVILDNSHFIDAARAVYGPDCIVRPLNAYVNIMGPTPFPFMPHLDVPAFRGFTRAEHPIWLLKVMQNSGLFERWRIRIATAVSWFYEGEGGDFHYWPEGPTGPRMTEAPPMRNVSIVADNEATFHGVAPVGPADARMPRGIDSHSRMVRGDGGWDVIDADGGVITSFTDEEVRITVSWKADIFADAAEARRADSGEDALDLDTVIDIFQTDLRARGEQIDRPTGGVLEESWVALIAATYPENPPQMN
ncbi:MAG: hypothetical protein EBX39_03860 [Actinobacteria bacterium]|nr:hypothetical protein [Actinomycetota bacterium]